MNIRNLGIVAHVDAGKTTITENMLYLSGSIRSMGSVDKGTAHTDWLEVERQRGISVRAASTGFTWKGVDINLIDTPGHVDFTAEVERSLQVLDCAVLVISAVEGIQAQTEILWNALHEMKIPTLIFINKIDRIGSNTRGVLLEVQKKLSSKAMPLQLVKNEATSEPLVINALTGYEDEGEAGSIYTSLVELIADRDDELLEKYLAGEAIKPAELLSKIADEVGNAEMYPVLFGAALKGIGISELLDAIVAYFPKPSADPAGNLSGVVFKIDHDKTMGRIAHVRLYSGAIRNRDTVYNATQDRLEKVAQVRKVYANRHEDIGLVNAGDIASICGLSHARIGDILGSPERVPSRYRLAEPLLTVQAYPSSDADYTSLVSALQELSDEDPMLDLQWLKNERELHVKIMGVIQLEVLTSILKSRFNIDVTFGAPTVIYKETPAKAGEGFDAYTMPKPCWAVLKFLIEPGERGSGLVYSSQVRDEKILMRYQNQVEKTLPQALKQGLYGWEVTDLKVTLIDGEHHVMHTHPLDFIVATPMAIMNGLVNTGTKLLEPVLKFRITVPEEIGGKVLGDIIQMRGSFDSPVISKGMFTVEGKFPAATSLDYPVKLGSMSGGRAVVSTRFLGYEECPVELGKTCPRRGVNPLDRSKYILSVRNALGEDWTP